jgi:hypothetical protein
MYIIFKKNAMLLNFVISIITKIQKNAYWSWWAIEAEIGGSWLSSGFSISSVVSIASWSTIVTIA